MGWPLALAAVCLALAGGSALQGESRSRNHGHNVCSTWGDFHYKTFDGDVFRFPGLCDYNLASDCRDAYKEFAVHLKRGLSEGGGLPRVESILITIKDDVIHLTHQLAVVNGDAVSTPHYSSGLLIEKNDAYTKVYSRAGLALMWNREDAVMLELDSRFQNSTCGLCGDYNGLQTYSEFLSEGVRFSVLEFGNMQKINEPGVVCEDPVEEPAPESCSEHRAACERLLAAAAFEDCQARVPVELYVRACEQDLCQCPPGGACECGTLAEFSRQCSHAGGQPGNWRTASLCPKSCPGNMVYLESGSPCQDTCSHLEVSSLCEEHRMDGCFCPEGTVYDDITDGGCVPVSRCPCRLHGDLYLPGQEVSNDCEQCTCQAGRWVCRDLPCPGTCALEGGAHISTFDGKRFTFHGDCYYVLTKGDHDSYAVLGELAPCGSTDKQTCLKTVVLLTDKNKNVVAFKSDGSVLLNELEVTLPHVAASFAIFQPSSYHIVVNTVLGLRLQVQLTPVMQLFVTLDQAARGQVQGLCGNFNGLETDDFMTSGGLVEATGASFANTWKAQTSCHDKLDWLDDPCSLNIESANYAEHWCSLLRKADSPFSKCHLAVDPTEYYKRCKYDTCNCQNNEDCMCAALSSYARACTAKGVMLWGWREHVCNKDVDSCPSSQVFLYNLTTCQQTCRSLSEGVTHCLKDFAPVDGCGCPDHTFLDEKGRCVPLAKCSCYHHGLYLEAGEVTLRQEERCVCQNGRLNCRRIKLLSQSCRPPKTLVDCNNLTALATQNPRPRSCQALVAGYYHTECVSGCVCPNGLLDDGRGGCVEEGACPCVHNKDLYLPGDRIKLDCNNTCICQKGRWECTQYPCHGTCSIYGSGHYMTFDGKHYDFNGDCSYVAVQDYCGQNSSSAAAGSFSIITENVPCGTTGVTCSKAIKIFIGGTELKLEDRHRVVKHLEEGRHVPFITREVGQYLVVEASSGIIVIWDKKTTVFIKLAPSYKGTVCGLCGNFDYRSDNDFTTRDHMVVTNELEFGNSWKEAPSCPDVTVDSTLDPCSVNPHRRSWAEKQCSIIKSRVFSGCHSKVDPTVFYEACVHDSCSCDSGGDCDCFCSAVASYAQECTKAEACVFWRTPDLCPIFCDYYNPPDECEWHYEPCGNRSFETCRTINGIHSNISVSYLEGCYPRCPQNKPIYDEDLKKCVTEDQCGCYIEDNRYLPGDPVPSDDICMNCTCTNSSQIICQIDIGKVINQTQDGAFCYSQICGPNGTETHFDICTSPAPSTPTTAVTTSFTPPMSVTTTTPGTVTSTTPKWCCIWSDWINENHPENGTNGRDHETFDGVCTAPEEIECRSTTEPHANRTDVQCNLTHGLVCEAEEGDTCDDYEIRVNTYHHTNLHTRHITTNHHATTNHIPHVSNTHHPTNLHHNHLINNTDQFTSTNDDSPTNLHHFTNTNTHHPTNLHRDHLINNTDQFTSTNDDSPTNLHHFTNTNTHHPTNLHHFTNTNTHHPTNLHHFTNTNTHHPTNLHHFTNTNTHHPTNLHHDHLINNTDQFTSTNDDSPTNLHHFTNTNTHHPTNLHRDHFITIHSHHASDNMCAGIAVSYPSTPIDQLGQTVVCNTSVGLICRNEDQNLSQPLLVPICLNYEINVYCSTTPPPTTSTSTTSPPTTTPPTSTTTSTPSTTTTTPSTTSPTPPETTTTPSTTSPVTPPTTTTTPSTTSPVTPPTTTTTPSTTAPTPPPTTTTPTTTTTPSTTSPTPPPTTTTTPSTTSPTPPPTTTTYPIHHISSHTSNHNQYPIHHFSNHTSNHNNLPIYHSNTSNHNNYPIHHSNTSKHNNYPIHHFSSDTFHHNHYPIHHFSNRTSKHNNYPIHHFNVNTFNYNHYTIHHFSRTPPSTTTSPSTPLPPSTVPTGPPSTPSQTPPSSSTPTTLLTTSTSVSWGSSATASPLTSPITRGTVITCCVLEDIFYSPGEVIYNRTSAGQCYQANCTEDCQIYTTTWPCPSTPSPTTTPPTTTPSPTTTPPTTTPPTTISTSTKPPADCPDFDPPRQVNETWWLCECYMATCKYNNTVEIEKVQCDPPPKPTCSNGLPPVRVEDPDHCCWHWECDCYCTGWGDPHYMTFDGLYYSYQGNCTYVLVEEISPTVDNFGVYIDNYHCDVNDKVSCPRTLIVRHETQEVLIKTVKMTPIKMQVQVNKQAVALPYQKYGVQVYESGINFVVNISRLGALISYNGLAFSIRLPYQLFGNNTKGQCGTCTNNTADDCVLPSGEIVSDCELSADHWVVNDPSKPHCPHTDSTTKRPATTTSGLQKPTPPKDCPGSPLCQLIKGSLFAPCHAVVPPKHYYDACVFDSCFVPDGGLECASVQIYAALCAQEGVCIDWRNHTQGACPMTCPSHREYRACGPTEEPTCKSSPTQQDSTSLVEGCFCPEGTINYAPGFDVCVETCGCMGPDNVPREFGERFMFDCKDCVCLEGGSGIVCQPRVCKQNGPSQCTEDGTYLVTELNPADACCGISSCKCNTSLCQEEPPLCLLGFEVKSKVVPGRCCPVYSCVPKGVCVHQNAEYQPGSPVYSSKCEDCKCTHAVDNSTQFNVISCTHVPCNSSCSPGFDLVEVPGECCKKCQQTKCVVERPNGQLIILEPGESRENLDDKCTYFSCTKINNQLTSLVSKIMCPEFDESSCVPGSITFMPNGCCKTCIPHNKTRIPCSTIPVMKEVVYEGCAKNVSMNYCSGSCGTFAMYSAQVQSLDHKCSCCKEDKTSQREVTLDCPDGRSLTHTYTHIESCLCQDTVCVLPQAQRGRVRRSGPRWGEN
ncbi:mucin-2 [Thomomys bottae]